MSVFISHSSKDKELIDLFVEKILILGCGLIDNQIFCTSIEGLGIKNGYDFRKHIKSRLKNADYSIIMISNNYKRSEVCMNEMGASWALDDVKIKQFLFPNIGFESLGLLLNIQQAAQINNPSALDELFEEFTLKYNTEKKVSRWNKHKNDFLLYVKSNYGLQSNIITPSPKDYFEGFIQENASLNHLLLKAHPTLLDCKAIFSEQYYSKLFIAYCNQFEYVEKDYMEPLYPKKKCVRIEKTNTLGLFNGKNTIAGGMVEAAKRGCFKDDVEFFTAVFLENETSEYGISYKVFCYVNDRWVFIPKPWRFL
jgi:hypothetical protein